MLILASKSPRRKELLTLITDDFVIRTADVDETLPDGIEPQNAVEELSKIKALPFENGSDTVIGADTIVVVDGRILGKPHDTAQAYEMLSLLSGREHSVYTGVTVIKGCDITTFSVETKVKFHTLSDEDINGYIATGEPFDKAGAYGIQGKVSLLSVFRPKKIMCERQ